MSINFLTPPLEKISYISIIKIAMKFICDFHIHSHYSIATSKNLTPEYLEYWCRLKGIQVVGTGDFTHPGWLEEIKEKFEPAEQGLFRLKNNYRLAETPHISVSSGGTVRFLLTSEISNIYKKYGKVRKVHNLLLAPDFETVEKIQSRLEKIGNIHSDGRPILGLDSRDLLEIALEASEKTFFVPSHIWTPWFSVLGSKSGFDTIEECYGDLTDHIHCVETGLSSDPPMNWICSFLDRYTLISNSDAHSPEKLGREANLFDTELSYNAITQALKTGDPKAFLGTVEFFPQEGKYHYDGHRKCGVRWDPLKTLKQGGLCPVCGKKVTIGVMNRVAQLADREDPNDRKKRHPYYSLIPLKEILSEITGVGPMSKKVSAAYNSVLQKAGSEFNLLLNLSPDDIKTAGSGILSEAVRRMRMREVYIKEGFDGEYGQVKVFNEDEKKDFGVQDTLFGDMSRKKDLPVQIRKPINFNLAEYRQLMQYQAQKEKANKKPELNAADTFTANPLKNLNQAQLKSAEHFEGPAVVLAGPGTGKTRVLTSRIANLILNKGIKPENILAVTFTNKASNEMKERLNALVSDKSVISEIRVCTFHRFGLSILSGYCEKTGRSRHFNIIDRDDREHILHINIGCEKKQLKDVSTAVTDAKQALLPADKINDKAFRLIFNKYEEILRKINAFDLDDLIYRSALLFSMYPEILSSYRKKYHWILIDEYQDINYAQYRLIRMLMPDPESNLYVIGDPDQAIYGFRGADVRFIGKFVEDYPGAGIYRLKKSYRCSDFILMASKGIIKNGDSIPGDTILQGIQKGVKIKISENSSDKSEAEFVARTIEKMIGGLRFFSLDSQVAEGTEEFDINSLSDFAVLCRIKEQMKTLEKAFNDHSIPFQAVSGASFLKQEPAKSVIDILKLAINPENSFLKETLIEKKIIDPSMIADLRDMIKDRRSVREAVNTTIENYLSSSYFSSLYANSGQSISSHSNNRHSSSGQSGSRPEKNDIAFKRMLSLTDDFGDRLEEFLRFSDLGAGIDTWEKSSEKVTLMTLHAAKGLEFKCVFITGCENNLIPYSLFEGQSSDFDEEKRLFYVGMTRAKKYLFLSHAKKRFIHGREYHPGKSPFLNSIENDLTDLLKSEYTKSPHKEDAQMDLF